jgi:hypothetical protein
MKYAKSVHINQSARNISCCNLVTNLALRSHHYHHYTPPYCSERCSAPLLTGFDINIGLTDTMCAPISQQESTRTQALRRFVATYLAHFVNLQRSTSEHVLPPWPLRMAITAEIAGSDTTPSTMASATIESATVMVMEAMRIGIGIQTARVRLSGMLLSRRRFMAMSRNTIHQLDAARE